MKYICTNCEYESLKWAGKCSNCGEWGSLEEKEEPVETKGSKGSINASSYKSISDSVNSPSSKKDSRTRISTHFNELDRVLGGGIVPGEVILLSGEPGVGKSTLLMQVLIKFLKGNKVLYVCGEESPDQLYSRLERLSGKKNFKKDLENFFVTDDVCVERVSQLISEEDFDFVIVDSIQSITSERSRSYPGSISQVRIAGVLLTRVAKLKNIPIFIVGQINKGGDIAGPKVLEHVVDCVLYVEGGEFNQYRILRSMKNRFGATNEIGVFEMTGQGLIEVGNPSLVFLDSGVKSSGSAIGAILQGSRVVFTEVQALVVKREGEGGPLRRVANGIKKPRLDMLCAVLSRKGGCFLGDKDVFVNIVGGLTVNDPSIDLAICAAIKSSVNDEILPKETIYFGEVGLTGEIRGSWGVDAVLKEASRVGYENAQVGRVRVKSVDGIKVKKVSSIKAL